MLKNSYIKTIIFVIINSTLLFQETKPSGVENRFTEDTIAIQNKQVDYKIKKENFFSKNKINPLSIFLTFENNQNNINDKNEFLIESDEQIESQDSFILKGNVIIEFNGAILKTDFIKFSKIDNTIISEGNIEYQNNNQLLKADKFNYDITKKTGSIQNVYGLIDIVTLSKDLNWESKDYKKTNINSKITRTKW